MKLLFNKFHIKSSTLIFVLTLYFGTVLNIRFWQYIFQHLTITNISVMWFACSLPFFIGIPLFLLFNLLIIKKITKPVVTCLLIICSITNYMMIKYGIYIDKNMIQNVFETNIREAGDLITLSLLLWVCVTGVVPTILLWLTDIQFQTFQKELKSRVIKSLFAILILGLFATTSFKEYASFGRNNRHIKSLINIVNFTAGTIGYVHKIQLSKRQFTILDSHPEHQDYIKDQSNTIYTVLIFILGETARASNFSLSNYSRETNPLLKKQDIVYFHETTSCGTATAVSVPCLFSHMIRSNFDSTDAQYTENIIDLAQKAGYHIIWRENDDGCKGVCDRVQDVQTMTKINNPKYCTENYCHDEALLDGLEDILRGIHQDTIIVLHTMGSHGPTYYQRYPDSFKKFQPTCDTSDIQNCTLPQIINTYDNTILYTDYIVSSTIDMMKKFPKFEAGVFYVSDHGESLGENNIYLHGMPYKIAPHEQTLVPMLIWMNDNMKKWDYIDYRCLKELAKDQHFSHDNLFHSLLGLLEIKTPVYDSEYDIFKSCRTKPLFSEKKI